MPPRAAHNGRPYTKVLSSLRKMELLRLCTEFRLSNEGPVVGLRNRLRDYLNLNRGNLVTNPRYRGLFPRHRRSDGTNSSSKTLSSRESSPANSYEAWNGIEDNPNHNLPIQPNIQPQQDHIPLQLEASPPPPSAVSFAVPERDSPHPPDFPINRREHHPFPFTLTITIYISTFPPLFVETSLSLPRRKTPHCLALVTIHMVTSTFSLKTLCTFVETLYSL